MTKQEEIQEGIADILEVWMTRDLALATARTIMAKGSYQGVVIKVRCSDCEWSQFKEEVAGMAPCYSCNSTGYIIEPLIKE